MIWRNRHWGIALSIAGTLSLACAPRLATGASDGNSPHFKASRHQENTSPPFTDERSAVSRAFVTDDTVAQDALDLGIHQMADRSSGPVRLVLAAPKVRLESSRCRLILDAPKQGPPAPLSAA
jgi:hypothetical protein